LASRSPIYTFQLTGYATESNEKKYICCFIRATHVINNIFKMMSLFKQNNIIIERIKRYILLERCCDVALTIYCLRKRCHETGSSDRKIRQEIDEHVDLCRLVTRHCRMIAGQSNDVLC